MKIFLPGSPIAYSKATFKKVLHIEISTSLGSLPKFEGATGQFKAAHGSQYPIISSPVQVGNNLGEIS